MALAAADVGFRQMLLDYKNELDIEKAKAIAEINNNVDDQLISKLIIRLSKGMNVDDAKAMIREVRKENSGRSHGVTNEDSE